MHTLKCKSIEELVEVVVETYELLHDCDRNVSFVVKYDHAKEILRELVFYDYDLKFVEPDERHQNTIHEPGRCAVQFFPFNHRVGADRIFAFDGSGHFFFG